MIFLFIIVLLILLIPIMINNKNTTLKLSNGFISGLDKVVNNYNEPLILKNILSKDECNYIIDTYDKQMQNATVGADRELNKDVRNNKVAWIDVNTNSSMVNKIYNKINELTGYGRDHCESIQIAKYMDGEYYKHHYDQCYDFNNNESCKKMLEEAKNYPRQYTMLIYLNDGYEGGYTDFPNMNKKFKGDEAGDGILFNLLNNQGNQVHEKSYHSGTNVNSGIKWIANIWIHNGKIR
jgi:prolyl 4-hydroxylase